MIKIEIVNRNSFVGNQRRAYESIFQVWYSTWKEEYSALNPRSVLHSDNFTRQDYALGIFVSNQCAAMTLFHEVDVSTSIGRLDSYFDPWPEELLNRIEKMRSNVLVCSAFTVAKEYRKFRMGRVILADLLACASLELLKRSSFPLMVGNMRNSRGANRVVYKFGAERLETIVCNSEESDLVMFRRDTLPEFPEAISTVLATAWPPSAMPSHFQVVA